MRSRNATLLLGMLLASSQVPALAVAADEHACDESLGLAEVAVAQARGKEALWTTALSALREARTARRNVDWEGCLEAAARARMLSELGLRQLEYPPERD